MLFNITKQKSLALLQLMAALFILISPSLIGKLPVNTGIYLMFAVFWALLCVRIKTTERVVVSINHFIYLILAAYGIVSSIWAGNAEGHLIYVFVLFTLMAFHSLAGDYFAENSNEGIKRRLMYLLSISGIICAVLNIFYWIFRVVPVGGGDALKQGIGTNNFLSVFMLFAIWASVLLLKGNSKLRKTLLSISSAAMIFVFLMAKSTVGWLFSILFILLCAAKKKLKSESKFLTVAIISVAFFLICTTVMLSFTGFPTAFPDVFNYAIKNPFGLGGGFWSAQAVFSSADLPEVPHVGLLAYMFASSGVLGIVCCALLLLRNLVLFLRLKTLESFAGLLLSIAVIILPFGGNIAVVLFWIGLNAYNEHVTAMNFRIQLKNETIKKATYVILIAIVVSSMLFVQTILRISAKNTYKNKDYDSAYTLYKIAATLNFTDSESCRNAVISLRKSGNILSSRDEAIHIIDKAIRRDRSNLKNIEEKALVYDACGEFELSAQQYREAAQKAFAKDEYNLLLVKELYKIVEKSPKGSSETKRAYEEIIQVAQTTENLNLKKEINDIADKAFKFTKGELPSEG